MCLLHPPVAHDLRTSNTNNLYDLRKKFRPPRVLAPRVQRRASLSRFASHRTTNNKGKPVVHSDDEDDNEGKACHDA